MKKERKEAIKSNEISEIRKYTLGGYEQKVLLDGKSKDNPIVIFLHGGPGAPIPFCAGCRGMFTEFTEKFIMVYWDQLGCGINNYVIDNSFTIENFADMTVDLINNIKNDFPNNKIIVFGVSWGSILAAKSSIKVPHLIDKVVVYGQVLKELTFNDEVFEAIAYTDKDKPYKTVMKFSKIRERREEHRLEDLKALTKLIRKYTEGYMAKSGKKMPIGSLIYGILTSPDYSLKDIKCILINGYRKNTSLIEELLRLDLSDAFKEIKVPYLIMQGETDIVTSTRMIKQYVEQSENQNLHIEVFPKSGHIPSADVFELITNRILNFAK